jgi:alpha-tubulin suppressor-like RCC1 family protein
MARLPLLKVLALTSLVAACGGSTAGVGASSGGSSGGASSGGGSSGSGGTSTSVAGSTPTTALSVSVDHACATRAADGATYCWGDNSWGQVGDGTQTNRLAPTSVTPARFLQLAVGGTHTCGLLQDRTVQCWGMDVYGSVGTGTTSAVRCSDNEPCVQKPVAVVGLTDVAQITAGTEHSCALTGDGAVWCWGDNRLGAVVGVPTDNYTAKPTPTKLALGPARAVAAGGNWSCAVLLAGTVSCWGNDPWNQNPTSASKLPITVGNVAAVAGLDHVSELALGRGFACARLDDGTARCWGSNAEGQLGDGSTTASAVPVVVAGVSDVAHVAVGETHACALLVDGRVLCWGDNAHGALGDGTLLGTDCARAATPPGPAGGGTPPPSAPTCRPHAQAVPGIAGAQALAAGGDASCVRLGDGSLTCWGASQYGLGDGTSTARLTPVPIAF